MTRVYPNSGRTRPTAKQRRRMVAALRERDGEGLSFDAFELAFDVEVGMRLVEEIIQRERERRGVSQTVMLDIVVEGRTVGTVPIGAVLELARAGRREEALANRLGLSDHDLGGEGGP